MRKPKQSEQSLEEDRLETRIRKDLKKSLRVYCANNDMTLREGVELAIGLLTSPRKHQPAPEGIQTTGAPQ